VELLQKTFRESMVCPYAHAQERKNTETWSQFLDHLDTSFGEEAKDGFDFLLNDDRNADLAPTRDPISL
jgi:hypothetical protein